jgi:Ran GTPase-activating protein (RanGAP) involved in mRNA processing and transport
MDLIESVKFESCDLDIELVETVSKFLFGCASTLEELTISRATPGHRGDEELNLAIFKMLSDIVPKMSKLKYLDLSYNKIKDESTPDLCDFLQVIPPSL